MDWSIADSYQKANHNPLAILNGDKSRDVIERQAAAGDLIELSAEGPPTPDGNQLSYHWFHYNEAEANATPPPFSSTTTANPKPRSKSPAPPAAASTSSSKSRTTAPLSPLLDPRRLTPPSAPAERKKGVALVRPRPLRSLSLENQLHSLIECSARHEPK